LHSHSDPCTVLRKGVNQKDDRLLFSLKSSGKNTYKQLITSESIYINDTMLGNKCHNISVVQELGKQKKKIIKQIAKERYEEVDISAYFEDMSRTSLRKKQRKRESKRDRRNKECCPSEGPIRNF
jgi:hypothetical protein